ncbi:MAG: iron reductase [Rhodospirillales bacterium]|nr:iron reductase [Rhodospirillales bacterium]
MNDRERLIVLALGTGVLFLAPGYLLHVSPRFPGSLTGGVLGITATLLVIAILFYPAVKYVAWLKRRVTPRLPLGRLLSLHIYGGLLASILAILHSGHKYESALGIALVVAILVIVATGFLGRYYLGHLGGEVRRQQTLLGTLRTAYDRAALVLATRRTAATPVADVPILDLVDALADAEYAIIAREAAKRIAGRWIVVHVAASIALYALLLMHIASGIYYGLRWLP